MIKCEKCGMQVDESSKFCTCCGSLMPIPALASDAPAGPGAEQPGFTPAESPAYVPPAPPVDPAQANPQPAMPFQQQPLQQPPVTPLGAPLAPIVSMGNWMGTLLLFALIPLALAIITGIVGGLVDNEVVTSVLGILTGFSGLILILIWAFNKKVNPSKRNFFKATLILYLISLVLVVVLVVLLITMSASIIAALGLDEANLQELLQYLEQFQNM